MVLGAAEGGVPWCRKPGCAWSQGLAARGVWQKPGRGPMVGAIGEEPELAPSLDTRFLSHRAQGVIKSLD